jgi:hypothetical protein
VAKKGHVSSKAPAKSTFKRTKAYRANGVAHIKDKSARKKVYNGRDDTIRSAIRDLNVRPNSKPSPVEQGSDGHVKRYHISYGQNFSHSRSPYGNQAHHILPVSAFTSPPFTLDAIAILKRAETYDINHGSNIILLPSDARSARFHGLPIHNGDHPKYTSGVQTDLGAIAQELAELTAEGHEDVEVPAELAKKLEDLQDVYWSRLADHTGSVNVSLSEA